MLGYSLSHPAEKQSQDEDAMHILCTSFVLCVRLQAVDIMAQMFELIVDNKERHLLAVFGHGGAQAETLELGDVLCR